MYQHHQSALPQQISTYTRDRILHRMEREEREEAESPADRFVDQVPLKKAYMVALLLALGWWSIRLHIVSVVTTTAAAATTTLIVVVVVVVFAITNFLNTLSFPTFSLPSGILRK